MKSKTTAPKKLVSKTTVRKRRKKIYVNDVAWYYADDPVDKRKTIEVVEMLGKIDFSTLLERDKEQPEQDKSSTE